MFLLLTYSFSVILDGLFIYYVIVFSDLQLQVILHGIQQSKTAYSIIHTMKRIRTKNYSYLSDMLFSVRASSE
jgi:hypothetical protein